MFLWLVSIWIGGALVLRVAREVAARVEGVLRDSRDSGLQKLVIRLKNIEDTISSGMSPGSDLWDRLADAPEPWSTALLPSITELRSSGAPVLPTLVRFRELAEYERESRRKARSRSAQARMQAVVCALAAPLCALILPRLLPGVDEPVARWWFLVSVAVLWGALGGVWIWRMAEHAGGGGLPASQRAAPLAYLMSGERVLAWISSGMSPDLAWARASESHLGGSILSAVWGRSVWEAPHASPAPRGAGALADKMAEHARQLRKSIQLSLIEGRPVRERLELGLLHFRADLEQCADRALETLATRALLPLFLCSAPAALLLLAYAVIAQWEGYSA